MMDLLALAKTAADRIEAEAAKLKVPVAVCVIDIHGNIVLTHRMGGAPVFAADIAERKAYTSALVRDRKSTRLNSSHGYISYAVFCLKKKKMRLLQKPTPRTRR